MRVLLITGGGGAGVTTVARASAVLCANQGRRVALLGAAQDADMRRVASAALTPTTVGDADARLTQAESVPSLVVAGGSAHRRGAADAGLESSIAPGKGGQLTVSTPDIRALLGGDDAEAIDWLGAVLRWGGLDDWLAADLHGLPGMDTVAALLSVVALTVDVVVVDLGALLPALQVLHLLCTDPAPRAAARPTGGVARLAGSVLARLADLPHPSARVRSTGDDLADRLARLRSILRDPQQTTIRLVLPADPRATVLRREGETVCGLHGIHLDAIIQRDPATPSPGSVSPGAAQEGSPLDEAAPSSRGPLTDVRIAHRIGEVTQHSISPTDTQEPLMLGRASNQGSGAMPNASARAYGLAGEATVPLVLRAPWLAHSPDRDEADADYAARIYADRAPDAALGSMRAPRFEVGVTTLDLVLPLPARPATDLRVRRLPNGIEVTAGRWRRVFPLPHGYTDWQGQRAWHDGDTFRVRFTVSGG